MTDISESMAPPFSLADWRLGHELTQEQAAIVLQISKRQIVHIEAGAVGLNELTMHRVSYFNSVTTPPRLKTWKVECHGENFEISNNYFYLGTSVASEGILRIDPIHASASALPHPSMDQFELQLDALRAAYGRYKIQNHHLTKIAHTIGYNRLPADIGNELVWGHWIQKDIRDYWRLTDKGRKRLGRRGRILEPAP